MNVRLSELIYSAGDIPRARERRQEAETYSDRGLNGGSQARVALAGLDDLRQPPTRHGHPEQRALCRATGLEPAAVHQGPGKRQARLNPHEEWIIEEVPDLRIVPNDLWAGAKRRTRAAGADEVFAL